MPEENKLLNAVKKSMRVTHNQLDSDFEAKINAALAEMKRVGIDVPADVDVAKDFLIVTGCELYVKWMDNYEDQGEIYHKSFEQLRDAISMSSGYKADDSDV